jgi:feruloyl-CoA synthase
MLGYHNRPAETAGALRNGWLHTGDLGRLDEEGRLYVIDRKKDMIISGGENIYSIEVENALCEHPHVLEVAVIGVPDALLGEALLAIVVPRNGAAISESDLIVHCRTLIGGYKIPRRFIISDRLPRTNVGKVMKNVLRDTYRDRT